MPATIRRLSFEPLEKRNMLAVLTVNSLLDSTSLGDGLVTLREAIAAANSNTPTDLGQIGSGADTIQFMASLSGTVSLSTIGDSAAGPSALHITSPITIRGNQNGITIQRGGAAPEMRLFRVAAGASLTLETINLTGGVARGEAGSTGQNGGDGRGGAVLNEGIVEIVATTFYDNKAIGGAPGAGGFTGRGVGGAIYNSAGSAIIRNSTLSGNQALNSSENSVSQSFGAGVYSLNGSLQVDNSTMTSNAAATGRGVYVFASGGTASLHVESSIIANGGDWYLNPDLLAAQDTEADVLISSGSHNLIRRSFNFGESWEVDPLLQPLQNNGGPTLTHALQSISPAINSGSNTLSLAGDQRGATFSRVVGGTADIGAFEQQQVSPALVGDYNRDTIVDAADYVMWRKTEGSVVEIYAGADGNGDTEIDQDDYVLWMKGFGEVLSTGFATGMDAASIAASDVDATDATFGDIGRLFEFRATAAVAKQRRKADLAASSFLSAEYQDLALLAVLAGRDGRSETQRDQSHDVCVPNDDRSAAVTGLALEATQPHAPLVLLDTI